MQLFAGKVLVPALGFDGRSGVIRTLDPLVPNEVRYQAALHSVRGMFKGFWRDLPTKSEAAFHSLAPKVCHGPA